MEVRAVVRLGKEEAEEVEGMVGRAPLFGLQAKAEDKVGRHAETTSAAHRTWQRQCRCGCLILVLVVGAETSDWTKRRKKERGVEGGASASARLGRDKGRAKNVPGNFL